MDQGATNLVLDAGHAFSGLLHRSELFAALRNHETVFATPELPAPDIGLFLQQTKYHAAPVRLNVTAGGKLMSFQRLQHGA